MKPKDSIKVDIIKLDKTYPEENALPEDGLYRYLYQPGAQHEGQKWRAIELSERANNCKNFFVQWCSFYVGSRSKNWSSCLIQPLVW